MRRIRIEIGGAVQGVGFRPFVYRLAGRLGLAGWVSNTPRGVLVEVEGNADAVDVFLNALQLEKPGPAVVDGVRWKEIDPLGAESFEIRESGRGIPEVFVPPDIATCWRCREEILDPSDRRYGYPFTNCTDCGPRFSIILSMPYDRRFTTMKSFDMCPECRREYRDPLNRRFHAQPNACPECGPRLELWDEKGNTLGLGDRALLMASEAILEGRVVALKGLGGFHLLVRADSDRSVRELRKRKGRRVKPFAVMVEDPDVASAFCEVLPEEKELLLSPQAPIVLLKKSKKGEEALSRFVAPENGELGVMLPYTPLHILLMRELGVPVVATSGNLTDEPICTDEREALARLGGAADLFLVHDRPIARHVDDSVVRVFRGKVMMVRRARGYAPFPFRALRKSTVPMLAVGGHLKNTVSVSASDRIFVSQHIGNLGDGKTVEAFDRAASDMKKLFGIDPGLVLSDMHPDYFSTRWAAETGMRVLKIQHHLAHVYSCMLDAGLEPPFLGVAWDGTGYGDDGTVWGGEFFHVTGKGARRVGRLKIFPLPGGDAAAGEPRRCALGLLHVISDDPLSRIGQGVFTEEDAVVLTDMLKKNVNTPSTSSVGRLFDAVSSLLGLVHVNDFEAHAAMALQHAAEGVDTPESYPFAVVERDDLLEMNWTPMIEGILEDRSRGLKTGIISARFHNTLADMILEAAKRVGEPRVLLTGGCFQNVLLLKRACSLLEDEGFRPVRHEGIPPNDGGISPGQLIAAMYGTEGVGNPDVPRSTGQDRKDTER